MNQNVQRLDRSAAAAAAVLGLVIMRQSDFIVVLLLAAVLAVISVIAVVAAIVCMCVCVCGTAGPTFLQAAARGAVVRSTSPGKSIMFHFTDSSCVMSQRAPIDRQSLPRVTGG